MYTKNVEPCKCSIFYLYIYSRFSTEVCEDDSRVFVLFVCDAFLSGVIGMHLFLFIITNVRLDPFKINRSELLIKG